MTAEDQEIRRRVQLLKRASYVLDHLSLSWFPNRLRVYSSMDGWIKSDHSTRILTNRRAGDWMAVQVELDVTTDQAPESNAAYTTARSMATLLEALDVEAIAALRDALFAATDDPGSVASARLAVFASSLCVAGEAYDLLRTAEEWERHTGIRVLDPDGWRDEPDFHTAWTTPITKEEWIERMSVSTVNVKNEKAGWR